MAPVVGIAYCLVIVRFGLRGAFESSSPVISKLRFSPTDQNDGENISMKSFAVGISDHTRSVVADEDSGSTPKAWHGTGGV